MSPAGREPARFTAAEAEQHLLSLELFGMRFGLERIAALLDELGRPQRAWRSVHVVGTNGKSSTVRMTAAILQRHGLRAGAYLSPHLASFTERVRIDDVDADPDLFAASVSRAATAAAVVRERTGDDEPATQFEVLTAAAFDCLTRAGAEACAIEAGLGGRYDATNVLDSEVQVLTSVGLEHTRWLGDTIAAIATEKLDVVTPGGTLVVAPDLDPDARAVADAVCAERGSRLVVAPTEPEHGIELLARGRFQRQNFALAVEAARALLGGELDPQAVAAAARATAIPGRVQVVGERPLTLIDGAHNASGIEALVGALPEIRGDRRLVGCVAVLDDKDAAAMLELLLPACDAVVMTRPGTPRALVPERLAELAAGLGYRGPVEIVAAPLAALARARDLAGGDGVVLATGSIYLVADLLAPERTGRSML